MQIRTRLTLQFSILVSTIVLLSFLSIYFLTVRFSEREFYRRLREKAITSAILLIKVQQIDSALMQVIDRASRDNLYRETVRVYDNEDKEIYSSGDTIRFPVTDVVRNSIRNNLEYRAKHKEYDLNGVLFKDGTNNYVVIIGAVDIYGASRLSDLRTLLIVSFFILTGIVSFAGWIYAGRALKPLTRIMNEVQNISPQNLEQRLKAGQHQDEMGKLIEIFNQLLDRIAKAFQVQKMFVSNVSHELKNPLTKITSQLEVTLLKDRTKEEYRDTIESVLEDTRGLNQLSNSLLELARLTRDSNSFTMSRIRLDEILWESRDFVCNIDSAYKVDLNLNDLPEDESELYIMANPYLLKIAFQNIVENACKFSSDRTAAIALSVEANVLIIKFKDKGPGIDHKDLQNVFQPFFRTDATSKVKGYGIGLSLSQRVISIHKGTITVESKPGEGTTFTVRLKSAATF